MQFGYFLFIMFNSLWKVMSAHGGTLTEFPEQVFINATLDQQSSPCAPCDLTLLTCLLIGSYRICIIPLLSSFHGKPNTRLWQSK